MRSRYGYLFGAFLLLFAFAVAGIAFSSAMSTMRGMQRVAMPGRAEIMLPVGPSTLYIETRSKVGDQVIDTGGAFRLQCELESPPGVAKVELIKPTSDIKYSLGGYKGHNGFDVLVETGGRYTLHCTSDGDQPFAIAIGAGVGAWIVVGVLAVIPLLGGVALLLVTFLRRRAAARRAAAGR